METTNPRNAVLTSRFATTVEDLEVVLNLRRAFFKDKPVSPDTSYRICCARNPHTMKLVYHSGEPIGYWSLIPTTPDAYHSFIAGESSHEEMLTEHCVPWSVVKPKEAYLYIVGAVVPFEFESENRRSDLLGGSISGGVLIDWCAFVWAIFERIGVKGICGYPSRNYGDKLLRKLGFRKSDVLIGADSNQPIFTLDESQMDHFRQSLSRLAGLSGRRVPIWEADDKQSFFDAYQL